METTELLQPLEAMLAQAQELIRLAGAEEWLAMDEQASKFQQQVVLLSDTTYIQALIDANMMESAKALIAQIQPLNEQLDLIANMERDKISSELRQMMKSEKALDAYSR